MEAMSATQCYAASMPPGIGGRYSSSHTRQCMPNQAASLCPVPLKAVEKHLSTKCGVSADKSRTVEVDLAVSQETLRMKSKGSALAAVAIFQHWSVQQVVGYLYPSDLLSYFFRRADTTIVQQVSQTPPLASSVAAHSKAISAAAAAATSALAPSLQSDADSLASPSSTRVTSAILVSFLVNYSLLVTDWWQFKHTARDRFLAYAYESELGYRASEVAAAAAAATAAVVLAYDALPISFRPQGLLPRLGGPSGRSGISDGKVDDSGSTADGTGGGVELRDDINPAMVWIQSAKDKQAEEKIRPTFGRPGFSFSAAGLLFSYHLGVAQYLIDHGLINEHTPLAGSSAGSIICAAVACGVDIRVAHDVTKRLCADCRENGTVFRLGILLRKVLEDIMPEDAHLRCSGRIRVAVTQVFGSPRGLLVDQFDSREDLINALITSSFVPGFLEPRPATVFRNRMCIDGGLTHFMPPTASEETVRVCAFPGSSFGLNNVAISPDLDPTFDISMRQLLFWALEAPSDDIIDSLFNNGYRDAASWASTYSSLPSALPLPAQ